MAISLSSHRLQNKETKFKGFEGLLKKLNDTPVNTLLSQGKDQGFSVSFSLTEKHEQTADASAIFIMEVSDLLKSL